MARSSDERILFHLKARGPQTAADLGARLGMTAIGARQHLCRLESEGLVDAEFRRQARGRPKKYWRLTQRGHGRFPDRHADLTLDLLRATRSLFGDNGLERLIRRREKESLAQYDSELSRRRSLRGKLAALAQIRSREGYMASYTPQPGGSYLFVEDHCPICAAAATCQGLCRSELTIFRKVLGRSVVIERVDHVLAGARRCAYRIRRAPAERAS
ncbi:MAG: metalloregulator ArsR/SmtB family transcription factor [Reyranellaceae bacterium]